MLRTYKNYGWGALGGGRHLLDILAVPGGPKAPYYLLLGDACWSPQPGVSFLFLIFDNLIRQIAAI